MKKINFHPLLTILILIGLWELFTQVITSSTLFPPFSRVVITGAELISNGVLIENLTKSFVRVIIGYLLGASLGILSGILTASYKTIDRSLSPIITLLHPIPSLGWLPILMLLIGINEMLPITLIFICAFFPIAYNTHYGIKRIDPDYIACAKILGASPAKILFKIKIPLASGNIFTGLKLEAGMVWRVLIAAEMVAIPTGIGALMIKAENLIRFDIIIVSLLTLSIMTILFEKLIILLEYKIIKWNT